MGVRKTWPSTSPKLHVRRRRSTQRPVRTDRNRRPRRPEGARTQYRMLMNDKIRAATSRFPAYLILALSAALPTLALSQAAPSTQLSGTQRITSNFKDQPIEVVADAVAAATGRIFILDPRVRAQVTLISYAPMTPQEFYQAFLSILQVHGFAAVPSGNVIKIIMDTNARFLPGNDLPDRIGNGSDEFVTQVIPVRNANANQLVQVLKPLSATYGHLASVPGSNTIVISDRASNVARIMKIIARVDQSGDANIEVIPLQNSTAADLVRTLNALNGNQPTDAGGLATRIVADERSNSVLVSGEPAQRLRIATLIAHLDTPVQGAGDADVRYLQYADAEKIAAKLKEQVSGIAASTTAGAAGGAPAAAAGGTAAADRNAIIVAEPETNALIITASPKMRKTLNTIIDQLDIPRAQVMLEAIIVDVSTNKSADLGVNWAVFSNEDGTSVPAGGFISPIAGGSIVNLAAGIVNKDVSQASALNGTTIGIGRLRQNGLNFGAMIRALRTDDNVNVIATPTATTLDNQETELKVAQEVPFITGSYASTGTGGTNNGQVNPFTTIQRQEVGTILKITPKINNGTAVVMKIELESSELSGQQGDANSLITNKRTIESTVLVDDGAIVVLGGLLQDEYSGNQDKVPGLGDVPLVGGLFRSETRSRRKTNLMVFLRPVVMRDARETSNLALDRYDLM
ncbi:MAG: type II secretion system protein GspD, partial [Proteobacteria bacterium]